MQQPSVVSLRSPESGAIDVDRRSVSLGGGGGSMAGSPMTVPSWMHQAVRVIDPYASDIFRILMTSNISKGETAFD